MTSSASATKAWRPFWQKSRSPVPVGRKRDLHRAGAGRYRTVLAFPAPGEDESTVEHDLNVIASNDVPPVDLYHVDAARLRIEAGAFAFPSGNHVRVGEKGGYCLRSGLYADLTLDGLAFKFCHRFSLHRIRPPL